MRIRLLLVAVLAVTGTMLAARAILGPLSYPLPVNSPMNLEGVFALAFLGLLVTRESRGPVAIARGWDFFLVASVVIIVIAAFVNYLDFPLLADDYLHIWNARHADAHALLAHFTSPEPDRFFRPAVYWSYAFDALWAGLSPTRWRAGNLAIHVANTLLVYRLCSDLRFGRAGAFVGALVFGLHGSRPEAVTWVAARFDLMAVMFGLASLLAVLHGAKWWVTSGLLALALMSKESAYVVPVLAVVFLRYVGLRWREIWSPIAPLFATAAVAFVYRLWLLRGIGGYRDAETGSAMVFHFGLVSTLNGLFPRFWGAMMFPLNWTGGLGKMTAISLAAVAAALAYLALRGTERRKAVLGIGVATICSLPVHQFLLIGMDLEKSRVLYFATVGLALLFAAIFEQTDSKLIVCAGVLIAFQWLSLRNNLGHWKQVGELAGRTCAAQALPLAQEQPNVVDGVYFLKMGFRECVMLNKPNEFK